MRQPFRSLNRWITCTFRDRDRSPARRTTAPPVHGLSVLAIVLLCYVAAVVTLAASDREALPDVRGEDGVWGGEDAGARVAAPDLAFNASAFNATALNATALNATALAVRLVAAGACDAASPHLEPLRLTGTDGLAAARSLLAACRSSRGVPHPSRSAMVVR